MALDANILGDDALASRRQFQAALGGISDSTFFRLRKEGRIPDEDAWVGTKSAWLVKTVKKTVESFTQASRPEHYQPHAGPGRPRKNRTADEGAGQGGAK